MSANEKEPFGLAHCDIDKYPWSEIISGEGLNECHDYYTAFNRAGSDCREKGDALGERVYSFLGAVASFLPTYDNLMKPYSSMWSGFNGRRSLQPDDLDEADLDVLASMANEISDPEYRARVCDVLWVTRKDFRAAQTAVVAFVESAKCLKEGDNWIPFVERLDRAALISARKGFEPQCKQVVDVVESAIAEYKDDLNSGFLCLRLMRIMLKLDKGDREYYTQLSETLATRFEQAEDWRTAQEYWRVTKAWNLRGKNESEANRCELAAAECDVSNAESIMANGKLTAMSAALSMSRGLEALRQATAAPERIKEIHLRLLDIQKKSTRELSGGLGNPEDSIPGLKEERARVQAASAQLVQGKPVEEALGLFAFLSKPTDLGALKQRDKEQAQQSALSRFFSATMMDSAGKITDRIPGITPGDPEDTEVTRKRLVQSARMVDWNTAVVWKIEPARIQISNEYPLRAGDLWFLVRDNPFIEPGHELIYLKGIQAGFYGDWLTSMHLLVPQIESSIRFVLQEQGVVTSTMDSDGIQKERDLNQLLWLDEVEAIFGQDILFDLRGILIERFGCNLRNELAHGLMSEGAFYTAEAPYMWWLIIHLCFIGHIAIKREETGRINPNNN
jgi:hypothetical protein